MNEKELLKEVFRICMKNEYMQALDFLISKMDKKLLNEAVEELTLEDIPFRKMYLDYQGRKLLKELLLKVKKEYKEILLNHMQNELVSEDFEKFLNEVLKEARKNRTRGIKNV